MSLPTGIWSWLARSLALAAIMLLATGWQASVQWQSLCLAGISSNEGGTEFPGEDEGGDSADGDLEVHLLFRRSLRESLPPGIVGGQSEPLVVTEDSARFSHALRTDRDAAACSTALLPLRC